MNKKMIGVIVAITLVVLAAVGVGTRYLNRAEPMEDGAVVPESETMETEASMEDNPMVAEPMAEENTIEKQEDVTVSENTMDAKGAMDSKEETMAPQKEIKEETPMNKGHLAPRFELMDLNGQSYNLEDLKGEKVYVKFWASWCPICLSGLDAVDKLSGEDNGFKVITIVSPGRNGEKQTEDFKEWFDGLKTQNITVLLDETGAVTKSFGVRAYPTSVYIGSDSILIKTLPGHVDNDSVKATMEGIY